MQSRLIHRHLTALAKIDVFLVQFIQPPSAALFERRLQRLPCEPNDSDVDSKFSSRKAVWVQVPPPVFLTVKGLALCRTLPPIHIEAHRWEEFGNNMALAQT